MKIIEPSKPDLEKHKNLYVLLYVLCMFIIGPIVFVNCLEHGLGALGVIIWLGVPIGIFSWCHTKGIWKLPTKEEKEAREEELRKKWSAPIKSAHLIRLERGLYTGLGNRRPRPAGRRTKKYKDL